MCQELVKNYLNLLDQWPVCSEFYNQIIEGNLIEHLVWLQIDDKTEQKSITSRPKSGTKSTSQKIKQIDFNYSEYSFTILYKLCRDYHACRAEFGRVGGLTKFIQKIESLNSETVTDSESKLIEVLCFSCKESVNRFRLKEQNHLVYLIKLQQRLKLKLISDENSLDSCLFNKLLVAICGFVHDPDSMNVLLSNGLVDSFLSFLNDSYLKTTSTFSNENDLKEFKLLLLNAVCSKRSVCLKSLLASTSSILNESKKRKASESAEQQSLNTSVTGKVKKSKLNRNSLITSSSSSSSPPANNNTPSHLSVKNLSIESNSMFVDYSTVSSLLFLF